MRGLVTKAGVLFLALMFVSLQSLPVATAKQASTIYLVELANNRCSVTGSPTTCGGAWTSIQTFKNELKPNEVVTVAFAYLYGDTNVINMSFSDSLNNNATMGASVCSATSPPICSAVGYFKVGNPGYDNILFTIQGGSTGEIWYNAGIWDGNPSRPQLAVGASASCSSNCSSSLSLSPVNVSASAALVISTYEAYYPYTPASWQFSYTYSYFATDVNPAGGDSVAWQGTATLLQSYSFQATTSPTPLSWAGAGEVVYWP